MNDAETFDVHRPAMLLRAFRMLADMERAEEMLHEAWLRWQRRQMSVDDPREFLLSIVTQICLDDLSARVRREHRDRAPAARN